MNQVDSGAYFKLIELGADDDFPEKHFTLYSEITGMHFGFAFWQNTLWLELGVAGNSSDRFTYVRQYATVILQHGFKFSDLDGAELASLEEGLARHLREYRE